MFLAVTPEVYRIVVVRHALIEVSVPIVESQFVGFTRTSWSTETPFPHCAGHVTSLLQRRPDCPRSRQQWTLAFEAQVVPNVTPLRHLIVVPDVRVSRVESRKKDCSRWCANRAAGVVVGEPHAFGGKPVQIRCADVPLTVAAQLTISEVVGNDENYVRLPV